MVFPLVPSHRSERKETNRTKPTCFLCVDSSRSRLYRLEREYYMHCVTWSTPMSRVIVFPSCSLFSAHLRRTMVRNRYCPLLVCIRKRRECVMQSSHTHTSNMKNENSAHISRFAKLLIRRIWTSKGRHRGLLIPV